MRLPAVRLTGQHCLYLTEGYGQFKKVRARASGQPGCDPASSSYFTAGSILRRSLMSAVLTPQPRPIRKHSPNVVQGGVPTADGENPLDLIRLPKGVEHLVHDLWIEARLPIEQLVVAVLIRVLMETDHGEDVLLVVGGRHRQRLPARCDTHLRPSPREWTVTTSPYRCHMEHYANCFCLL